MGVSGCFEGEEGKRIRKSFREIWKRFKQFEYQQSKQCSGMNATFNSYDSFILF
jgi:hypothetical protein